MEQNVPEIELNALFCSIFQVKYMAKGLAISAAVLLGCLLLVSFPAEARTPRVEDKWSNGIWIFSPANTTYTSNGLLLNVTAKRNFSPNYYNTQLKYSLNNAENVTIPIKAAFLDMSIPGTTFSWLASYTLFSGQIALPKLPEGIYCLTVYGEYNRAEDVDPKYPNMHDIQSIYFVINNGIPPVITLLEFENVIYEIDNFQLNFTVSEPVSWIGYSVDCQDNVTVSGNSTLLELSYGNHNVTIYAKDLLGNIGASETASFTVAKPGQNEPWPVEVIATAIAILCISAAILLLYKKLQFKKGKVDLHS
jgi:hypothetical protein